METPTAGVLLREVARLHAHSQREQVDKGWLSRAVETLVQEGLLTKALGDADRRTIRIALSPAGQTRFQQLNETLNAHAERVMARIPPAEREQVAHTLAQLYQALQAEAAATAGILSGEEEHR
ncbi:MAG: hypothetical protein E6J22_20155 [Chloroflexi bacterium]|nr:MAG: hypothetical protein E6J22_20155 [Chloroflexota bacterium]